MNIRVFVAVRGDGSSCSVEKRHLCFEPWQQIGEEMGYTAWWAQMKYRMALLAVEGGYWRGWRDDLRGKLAIAFSDNALDKEKDIEVHKPGTCCPSN